MHSTTELEVILYNSQANSFRLRPQAHRGCLSKAVPNPRNGRSTSERWLVRGGEYPCRASLKLALGAMLTKKRQNERVCAPNPLPCPPFAGSSRWVVGIGKHVSLFDNCFIFLERPRMFHQAGVAV